MVRGAPKFQQSNASHFPINKLKNTAAHHRNDKANKNSQSMISYRLCEPCRRCRPLSAADT